MKHTEQRQRTQAVIILTAITMVVEVVAGYLTGSMALLADGWHMGSHVGALGIAWLGYYLADKQSFRSRFTFGGGKVLVLGGYTSAVLLIVTASWMIMESVERFLNPTGIRTREAMIVAVIGLVVNLVSALILQHKHDDHGHSHSPACSHDHGSKHSHVKVQTHTHHHGHDHHHHDLNMAGAYAHVLADALTSVLALVALGLAEWKGWLWADPIVGVLGAIMIIRWGVSLLRQSAHELLDGTDSSIPSSGIQQYLEKRGFNVSCLHVWRLDGENTAVHLRISQAGFRTEDLPALRHDLMKTYPIGHLVVEVSGTNSENCPL